jgi:DNA polymerase
MHRLDVVDQVLSCTRCELHAQCTAPVPLHGKGGWVAVGEAPGETEDLVGQPFVGPAGKLLKSVLEEFRFPEPALVNTVSCFPHGTPTWDHINACDRNKWDQIEVLDPKFVLLLGKVALKAMRPDLDLKRGRTRPFRMKGRVCFATYHPAAALRSGQYEESMRADLEIFREVIEAGRDGWMKYIPQSCAACPVDATWYEADSALGWCPVHLPDTERPAYEARQKVLKQEYEAARQNLAGGGYVGSDYPSTSQHAAATVKAASQQAHLLVLVDDAGDQGLTCWEATRDSSWDTIRPGIAENQVAARMLRLRELGLVEYLKDDVGEDVERTTKTSTAKVHVVTVDGHREAAHHRALARS